MHRFLGFLGMVILLLAMVNHAHADTGREDAEGLRVGVVLEAGEIDSSTVEVGALVVVVYGQGERHPTSGEWAKLDTARGYVKAVSRRSLILSLERNGQLESIAVKRIQTLRLIRSLSTLADTEDEVPTFLKTDGWRSRVLRKYAVGSLSGGASAVIGLVIGLADNHCPDFKENELICIGNGPLWGMSIGYVVGTAFGVSITDPHDKFMYTLAGSLLGFGAGFVSEGNVPLSILLPLPMAIFASEWLRNPPEKFRISVNLVPNTRRPPSAVFTLRF